MLQAFVLFLSSGDQVIANILPPKLAYGDIRQHQHLAVIKRQGDLGIHIALYICHKRQCIPYISALRCGNAAKLHLITGKLGSIKVHTVHPDSF